jgi:hypothetical protein
MKKYKFSLGEVNDATPAELCVIVQKTLGSNAGGDLVGAAAHYLKQIANSDEIKQNLACDTLILYVKDGLVATVEGETKGEVPK